MYLLAQTPVQFYQRRSQGALFRLSAPRTFELTMIYTMPRILDSFWALCNYSAALSLETWMRASAWS